MKAPHGLALGVLLAAAALAPPQIARADVRVSAPAWPDSAVREVTQRARALRRAAQRDSALRVLAPLLAPSVRRTLSPAARLDLCRIACTLRGEAGDTRGAIELGREGLPIAAALRDTTARIGLSLYMATALRQIGQVDEARAAASQALALSRRRRDVPGQVTALNELAGAEAQRGRNPAARRLYGEALGLALAARDSSRASIFLANIGQRHLVESRADSARAYLTRSLRMSEGARDPRATALALRQLATLEVYHGDPSVALERYERVAQILRVRGMGPDALVAGHDRAEVLFWLGRRDEAYRLADSVRSDAARLGQRLAEVETGALLGRIALAEGRPAAAAAEFRRALSRSPDPESRMRSATNLAQSLIELDSLQAADAALAEFRDLPAGQVTPSQLANTGTIQAEVDQRLGRHRAAIEDARRVEALAGPLGEILPMLDAMAVRARAERALGRPADAERTLDRALAAWEGKRAQASDPQWRERYSARVRHVVAERVALALARGPTRSAGAERALAVVERYKARTLLERVHEPGRLPRARPAPAFDLAEWRRAALAPEDLFLESFAAEDTTWIFAITRDHLRIHGVGPMRGELGRRLARLRAVASTRPEGSGGASAVLASAAVIGRELLRPVADLLATHRRVLVSPDDRLALVPFGLLSASDDPLVATHVVAEVPAAVALPGLRRRAVARAAGPATVLAFAGPRPGESRALPGARAEVESIRRLDPRARVVEGATGRERVALAGFEGLHFAAHAVASDQAPWSSGILLGRPSEDGADPYLRAASVAGMRLDARLAVLSGCETAGGALVRGEGLLGLSGAFLAAGVPSVVASLWKVDDRSVARLMERFYQALAAGGTAGAALRAAQNALRREPETAHPYHWAGFVVYGAPDARLRLGAPPARRSR